MRKIRQRGNSMAEMALVVMILLSMILFILEMGRVVVTQQFISERARATVRAAVVNNWTATDAQNYFCFGQLSPPAGVTVGFLGVMPAQVSYALLGTSGTSDYRVRLQVSGVRVLTLVPYIAGQYTLAPVVATMPAQSLGATD